MEHSTVKLTLHNYGFASPYNPRGLQVVLRNADDSDSIWFVYIPDDPRFWLGGDTIQMAYKLGIPENIPVGEYDLFLHLPDPEERLHGNPDYSIRLANRNLWEEKTGFNRLQHQLIIIDESRQIIPYAGDLIFQKVK